MLNKSEIRVHKTEYLDEEGLQILWEKIKEYVRNNTSTINPDDVNIDLSNYITKEMLEEALNNVEVDLSPYVTNTDLTAELLNYAKSNHTHTGYATESYVDSAIANAELGTGTGEIDLSSYLKKSEAESTYQPKGDYLTEHQDISNKSDVGHKHTKSDITDLDNITAPDMSNYFTKTETEGKIRAYRDEYDDYLVEEVLPLKADLSNVYTKEEIDNQIIITENKVVATTEIVTGTLVGKALPTITTYDGGTIFHVTNNYLDNTSIKAAIKLSDELMITDYISSDNGVITLENTQAGELDDYIIKGVYHPSQPDLPVTYNKGDDGGYIVGLDYSNTFQTYTNYIHVLNASGYSNSEKVDYAVFDVSQVSGNINFYIISPYSFTGYIFCDDVWKTRLTSDSWKYPIDVTELNTVKICCKLKSTIEFPSTIEGSCLYNYVEEITDPLSYTLWSTNIDSTEESEHYTITFNDKFGTDKVCRFSSKPIYKNKDGLQIKDGVSPIINIEEVSNGHKVSITDAEGSKEFTILDGTIPSLDGYATETFVTEQISNIPSTDLSDYYNKEEVNNALDNKSNTGHTHNASEITGLSGITNPDMSNYYTKDENYNKEEIDNMIPSLDGYLRYSVVTEVPETQEEGVLYLVTE